jgi:hypothetical protein
LVDFPLVDFSYPVQVLWLILVILFRSFGLLKLAPKDFKIIWLSDIMVLSVPDEGYSRNHGVH